MDRTNVFVGPEDRAVIEVVQPRYGVATEADAIRLALRVLAAPGLRSSCPRAPRMPIAPRKRPRANSHAR